jgi:hypothetical protein
VAKPAERRLTGVSAEQFHGAASDLPSRLLCSERVAAGLRVPRTVVTAPVPHARKLGGLFLAPARISAVASSSRAPSLSAHREVVDRLTERFRDLPKRRPYFSCIERRTNLGYG